MAFDKKKYIQNYVKENYNSRAAEPDRERLLINCTYNLIFPLLQDPD